MVGVESSTTPDVRSNSKARRSKSNSKHRQDPSPSSANATATASTTAIASSPRKWSLFHRGNTTGTQSSKKPITLFQSRRRRQQLQQQQQQQQQQNQSLNRELPSDQPNTGISRRAARKPNVKVPTGNKTNTSNVKAAVETPATEQPATSHTYSPTMGQSDNDPRANSSQRTDATTTTETNHFNQRLQRSVSGSTPVASGTTTNTRAGSERAVLIFDREKRANPSDETIQENHADKNRFIIVGKTIGAIVSIIILGWLLMYLPTKIVEGGQFVKSVFDSFASRMLTLGHVLRVGFTVAVWAGTFFGWGYLVKNTKEFIERRRSDFNPNLVNLNNAGAHIAELTDDYSKMNQNDKPNSRQSFQGKFQVNNLTVATKIQDDHAS